MWRPVNFFSIQLDESTDAVDTAQLAISVKMVFDDFSTKEEFLKILPLTARNQGKDIFLLFKKFAIENKLPLQKLSSITTDSAREMTENENTEFKDLLLHTEVRWLTRGKVLERFINLLPQVKEFVASRNEVYEELENKNWLCLMLDFW
ncbi:general transcription factor II-I repeat domain-containing protein 2 [Trichonephila clavipes]|nr:general transcription factor II-I repeat domain-containing protein 2 [Trichonephila clavipes]